MKIDTAKPDTLGEFLSELHCSPVGWHNGRTTWKILSPLSFFYTRLKILITVPSGFITDFASIPRLPFFWWLASDYGHAAAVLHDFLWHSDLLTRTEANLLFYDALLVSGVPRWRAWLMFRAVSVYTLAS